MVTVGLVQQDIGPRPAGQLRPMAPMAQLVAEASGRGADFVVLPELWRFGAFELPTLVELAEPLDGPTVAALSEWARAHHVWLHGGSILERAADGLYNTSVLFNDSGELLASYRKRHLFGFDTGEAALLRAGDDLVVVDTPLGATGLATCYDLRFPEQFRALVDAGAETVLLPAGWPTARAEHWVVLGQARAIENQTWLLAANAVGTTGEVALAGQSAVIDPLGVATRLGTEQAVLIANVDPAAVAAARTAFPVLRDRR